MLEPNLMDAIKRLFALSWFEIGFEYDKLTDLEQDMVSREDFDKLQNWVREGEIGDTPGPAERAAWDAHEKAAKLRKMRLPK
jgi:hypothetical protein